MKKYYNYSIPKKNEVHEYEHTHIEFEIMDCIGNDMIFKVQCIAYKNDYKNPLLNVTLDWDAYEESFDEFVKFTMKDHLVPLFG